MERKLSDDLIIGAKSIAQEMGLTPRQIFHLAETGQFPIFRIGRKLAARRSTVSQHIADMERAQVAAKAPKVA